MQMVLMVFRTSLETEVLPLIEHEQLPYTRLDGAQGKGLTGHVPGSSMWGGANTVVLLAVSDDRLASFRERILKYNEDCKSRPKPVTVPFHVFILPCIQWF
ncbi:hypothetical protein W02_36410 [Nitrospira sp. KM1]|uniref:hypothetical protein n=1 Tax=Nitrospira sp. KM1 TaxID=1936990 RepID=UPI0013A76049|nr:hypothetical protein [Nitrospira sp. KM1]BCA56501.1 hypothetical protein W02_36410 [Nitrospira sp. KM1]